jgi:hypothetical protein
MSGAARRLAAVVALGAATLASRAAFAQSSYGGGAASAPANSTNDELRGFEVGLRLGYVAPAGKTGGVSSYGGILNESDLPDLSKRASGGFDMIFDVGHRTSRIFYYGLQVALAPAMGSEPDGSSLNVRVGPNLRVHPHLSFIPEKIDPYLGFGLGYDFLSFSSTSASPTISLHGMEFANILVGTDYLVLPTLSAGLFFSTSIGMYFANSDASFHLTSTHEWFTFGIRGAYRL